MHFKRSRISILSFVALAPLFLITGMALATPVQEVTIGAPPARKSLLQDVDLSLEYSVRSDLNQNSSPHDYDHALELSASKEVWSKYTVFASAGMEYSTLGSTTVVRATSTDSYFTGRDVDLGIATDYKISDTNSIKAFLTEDILTSTESRYFGYRSVTSGRGFLTSKIWPWMGIRQMIDATYVLNRYRYAPVSSGANIKVGDINPDALISYSVGPVFKLFDGLRIMADLTVRGTHYLDGTDLYGFGNSYTMSYAISNVSVWVKYLNRGYADRGETNLWFADQYRKLASGGITVDF